MNWKDNVIIYEQLHEASNSISAGYSILSYSFPNHVQAKEWEAKSLLWNKYWLDMKDLVLCSEEEADKEIALLNENLRELRKLQNQIYFLQ